MSWIVYQRVDSIAQEVDDPTLSMNCLKTTGTHRSYKQEDNRLVQHYGTIRRLLFYEDIDQLRYIPLILTQNWRKICWQNRKASLHLIDNNINQAMFEICMRSLATGSHDIVMYCGTQEVAEPNIMLGNVCIFPNGGFGNKCSKLWAGEEYRTPLHAW